MNELARSAHPQFSTTNVTVRRNIFRAGMGVAVGSETAGGVANVTVEHNTFWGEGWSVALHVKTAPQVRAAPIQRAPCLMLQYATAASPCLLAEGKYD